MANFPQRLLRHLRLTRLAARPPRDPGTPPFLILFINSICNQSCEHCFYWQNLNRRDDLTVAELDALSRDLGQVEILNLSGGEPFLRQEFGEICRKFITRNGVKQIYVPTNGSFPDRTVRAVEDVLREPGLQLFAAELSLDGMAEYHDRFRGMKDAFRRAMETYDALAEMQKRDQRLRIHAISTLTSENLGEVRRLTDHLLERCPAMDHHNLAMIRGDRKNPLLEGPVVAEYEALYAHVKRAWAVREEGRFGSAVEPMMQWAKTKTARQQRQIAPCKAGTLNAVVYSNGDVSVCESHAPLGNLRQRSFREIWSSAEAVALRRSIAARECWCTNEVFLWPSIVYQPVQLVRAWLGAKAWRKTDPANAAEPESRPAGQFPIIR
ncbi:MAG: radical SAM protein [Acidobacteria bacterium]|nr:radical SAM protein [Acidobacteriota bacterium]